MEFLFELPFPLVGNDFAHGQFRDFTRIDDHESFEIENAFKFAKRDIEQMPDARGQALEEPDVRTGAGQFDVAKALAAHAGERHFHAALIADDSAMLHPLVLAAEAFPVGYRSEDAGAEQTVAFRLERTVINSFRLGDFAEAPASDLFRTRQRDADRIKIRGQIRSFVG